MTEYRAAFNPPVSLGATKSPGAGLLPRREPEWAQHGRPCWKDASIAACSMPPWKPGGPTGANHSHSSVSPRLTRPTRSSSARSVTPTRTSTPTTAATAATATSPPLPLPPTRTTTATTAAATATTAATRTTTAAPTRTTISQRGDRSMTPPKSRVSTPPRSIGKSDGELVQPRTGSSEKSRPRTPPKAKLKKMEVAVVEDSGNDDIVTASKATDPSTAPNLKNRWSAFRRASEASGGSSWTASTRVGASSCGSASARLRQPPPPSSGSLLGACREEPDNQTHLPNVNYYSDHDLDHDYVRETHHDHDHDSHRREKNSRITGGSAKPSFRGTFCQNPLGQQGFLGGSQQFGGDEEDEAVISFDATRRWPGPDADLQRLGEELGALRIENCKLRERLADAERRDRGDDEDEVDELREENHRLRQALSDAESQRDREYAESRSQLKQLTAELDALRESLRSAEKNRSREVGDAWAAADEAEAKHQQTLQTLRSLLPPGGRRGGSPSASSQKYEDDLEPLELSPPSRTAGSRHYHGELHSSPYRNSFEGPFRRSREVVAQPSGEEEGFGTPLISSPLSPQSQSSRGPGSPWPRSGDRTHQHQEPQRSTPESFGAPYRGGFEGGSPPGARRSPLPLQ
mmetsp:Transcript_14566/g.31533  ORF Transcript_14566/g.31533 Transcript_14566/m.31533 type:complete len:633 (-) Transcript_14566:31-1929(-)